MAKVSKSNSSAGRDTQDAAVQTTSKGIFEGIGGKMGVILNAGSEPIKSTIGINSFNKDQRAAMNGWKLMQYAVRTGRK